MKLATVQYKGETYVAAKGEGNKLLLLQPAAEKMAGHTDYIPNDMLAIIQSGEEALAKINEVFEWTKRTGEFLLDEDEVTFLAPIPKPSKNIFCVGKNYRDHAIEMGSEADIPKHIMLFSKAPTTVIGHKEGIPNHSEVTNELDYEGELAIVIGKTGKAIPKEAALDHIFGYTIINDVTARDLQAKHKQFLLGKSLDGSCPMGPYIVHKCLIEDPKVLDIVTKVNGEIRQKGNTSQFIFPIEEIISVISRGMTLEAGDIIATGTPAGVGKGFNPPKFLKSGDVIEISVQSIGTLQNSVQ